MKGKVLGISIVKHAKYLGIILDRNLLFKEQMQMWKERARSTRQKFLLMKYYGKEKWAAKLTLWHAYLKSGFLYGLNIMYPFLSKSKRQEVKRLYTTTLK